jgi:hypothetical protein
MTKPIKTIPGDTVLCRQDGFALVTAIMMLFVAMILGLMVADSADMEILLSGAQQRYEENFNTTEGGAGVEASAVGSGEDIARNGSTHSYSVVNPADTNKVLSPDSTVTLATSPELWPTDNLIKSYAAGDDNLDYQYRVIYLHDDSPPKGYDAGQFSGYLFQIDAQRSSRIEMGGNKVGPKMSL